MTNPVLRYFPAELLRVGNLSWEIQGGTIGSGQTASGAMPMTRLDGGGLWKATLGKIMVWSPDMRRSWHALAALCDGGAQPIIVPVIERVDSPWPTDLVGAPLNQVGVPTFTQVAHSDDALFDDNTGYDNGIIEIETVGAVALRATSMTVRVVSGSELRGGEYFSVDHLDLRKRLYRVAAAVGSGLTGNDRYTKILLHLDSSPITDSNVGGSAHPWTAVGGAQIDTSQSKFGGASGLFDGTGDYLTTPAHADFTIGSGDFTVDCWFNCTATTGSFQFLAGQRNAAGTATTESFSLLRLNSNLMRGQVSVGASSFTVDSTTQFTNAVNAGWHHIALVRTGNILKLFIDGTQEGGNVAITGTVNTNNTDVFGVGILGAATSPSWTGRIEEFRLSVGVARWTTTFTPPDRAYGDPSIWDLTFRPPMRAAIPDAFALDFDKPGCVMRLSSPNSMDLLFDQPPFIGTPSVDFIEAFPPFPA